MMAIMKTLVLIFCLLISACQAISTTGSFFSQISDHNQESATKDRPILDENVFKCGRSQACRMVGKQTNGKYETLNSYDIEKREIFVGSDFLSPS